MIFSQVISRLIWSHLYSNSNEGNELNKRTYACLNVTQSVNVSPSEQNFAIHMLIYMSLTSLLKICQLPTTQLSWLVLKN